MQHFVSKEKYCPIFTCPAWFFYFTCLYLPLHWNWKIPIIKGWQILMCPMGSVWFCFIYIVCVQFSHKTEKFPSWKSLIKSTLNFFDNKIYDNRSECVHWKSGWFCFISILSVHFSNKTEKFSFWKSLKYFNFFW